MTEKKKTPKITSFLTYEDNPFKVEMQLRTFVPKEGEQMVTDNATGELFMQYRIPQSKTVVHDPKPYTKWFHGTGKLVTKLTEASTRLLYYILDNAKPGRDMVCIDKSSYLEYAGYTPENKFAYYKALQGLLEHSIIARKVGESSCFFLNANILFNGDRTKLKGAELYSPATNISIKRDKSSIQSDNQ